MCKQFKKKVPLNQKGILSKLLNRLYYVVRIVHTGFSRQDDGKKKPVWIEAITMVFVTSVECNFSQLFCFDGIQSKSHMCHS